MIRYSLFDLTKIQVYSTKGEFLCVAKRVTLTHPMANTLGTSNYNIKSKNLKPNTSAGLLSEENLLVSKKSGEYKPVTVYTDPLTGRKIAPDVGWSYNPAQ
jgi:hypothetical protein